AYLLMLKPRMSWSVVRAWCSFIKWHKSLSMKRKGVVRSVKVRNIYRGSILLRYICGKRHFNDVM
ncbi:MAG: glycosyltransferase family 2 protein, partial [Alistipes sp.]|nr:glycosyltransferase family 2 protein [Alistipes sp.]